MTSNPAPGDRAVFGFTAALRGGTHGDNDRHWIVHRKFLRLFLAGENVRAELTKWEAETGLGPCADNLRAVVATLADLAETFGVADVQGLFRESAVQPCTAARVQAAWQTHVTALDQFSVVADAASRYIWDSAAQFLEQFDLPWDWLRQDMVRWFEECLDARIEGREPALRLHAERLPVRAPSWAFVFVRDTTETPEDALARFGHEAADYQNQLKQLLLRAGRGAQQDREALERGAKCLYRREVLHHTKYKIAQDLFGDHAQHKQVTEGCTRARESLALAGPYTPVYFPLTPTRPDR